MKSKVLVKGATGMQGMAITSKLLNEGYEVIAPARSESKVVMLEEQGVQGLLSDFSVQSLSTISNGIKYAIVIVPSVIPTDEMLPFVDTSLNAVRKGGVENAILHISSVIPEKEVGIKGPDARLKMKELAFQIFPEVTVTSSTIYLENLSTAYRSNILEEGVIPQAIAADSVVSYLSMDDLAQYFSAILKDDSFKGQFLKLGGSESLNGDQLAEVISKTVDKKVVYHALEPEQVKGFLTPILGKEMAAQIAEMYSWEGTSGKEKLAIDSTDLQSKLGLSLPSVEQWSKNEFKK